MTYQKLGLLLTASSLLLTGCLSAAPDLTPTEKETQQALSSSNYQPAPRELRDNIETQEVLAQAAFWSHEYNLNPSDLEAAIKFSAVLRKLGNPNRAVEVTRTTRALYPRNPYLNAEYAAALLADQKTRPALKILDNSIKDTPAYGRLWSLKGVALDQMEKYAEARPFYQRALQITPNDPNVMANLGLNFALSGDPHTAKTWLSRAAAHPNASDNVYANLELVEALVAEAGPSSRAGSTQYQPRAKATLPQASQTPRQYAPQASLPTDSAAPRQYGAYAAPSPTAQPTLQRPQTPSLRRQAPAPATSQGYHGAAAPRLEASPAKPVATSQDVLARIANNVKAKSSPQRAPRRYIPHPQQRQAYQGQAPQGYQPQPGYADPRQAQQQGGRQVQRQAQQQAPAAPQYRQAAPQNYTAQNYAAPNQYQGQYQQQAANPNQYQNPQNNSAQYNQQAPQIRGGYPSPQAPYYEAPNAQPQTPPQRRPAARRRG